ncbi:hypothetical protein PIB30_105029, partial [Stylosanthes scabra]|nr:hypothetical protein [Stylosanthes scabra]
AIASPTNVSKVFIKFLKKNIFSRFGVPRTLISDGATSTFLWSQAQDLNPQPSPNKWASGGVK